MTSRRLRVLIQHLPPESATMTALRNELTDEELAEQADNGRPEKGRWSQQEQLLAAAVDSIRRLEFITVCANTEEKDRPDPPEPIKRPGARARPPRPVLSESDNELLFQLINGGAA
ncbi:hypothetical protein [Streptomyces sp. NPDC056670]|uniref:hypothetical protein n=1 Tax=Streptomyces sp. NPDC056670 TaxID=3345904 RepID=UPI0036778FB2